MKRFPSNWEARQLSDFVERFESGVSVNAEDVSASNGDFAVLKLSCVAKGIFDPKENKRILPEEVSKARISPKRGRIIISRSNTVELVGANAYVEEDYPNLFLPDTLWQSVYRKDVVFSSRWLSYVLQSPPTRRLFGNLASGTSGSMKKLTRSSVLGIEIMMPPREEQLVMADILLCWDQRIQKLEQLIAEKIKFKRGLMQRLLTGRKRFKEFKGKEWKQLHLGDLAIESELRNNGRLTEKSLYAVTKLYGTIPMRERVQGESVERCKVVSKDWFAYNPMRLNIGSIAKWNNEEDVLVSPDYVVFQCDETRLDPDFLNHYRRSHRWTKFVEKAGDGSVRVRIWFSHLAELKLSLPPLPEQRRIAAVLNACDRELDLLREQLVEFKMQKQGLMQKLLTGQIRVKVAKEAKGAKRTSTQTGV